MSEQKYISIRLTGLWEHEDSKGKKYLSGSINNYAKLIAFPNGYKKHNKSSPDYWLYLNPTNKKQDQEPEQGLLLEDELKA